MDFLKKPLLSYSFLLLLSLIIYFGFNAYIQIIFLYMFINIIMALSLNLINGFTGQFSLGHAGFMAIGAYFSAFASQKLVLFPEYLQFFNFVLWSIGAGILAALVGLAVGLPSLRLKGDYLAIVTLGFGEIIRVTLLNIDALGGPRGIAGITSFPEQIFGIQVDSFIIASSYAAFWTLICLFFLIRILNSTFGRTFKSVREDEIAASSLGINTTKVKISSFMISSFFAGIAGHLFAHVTGYIAPSTFSFLLSINAVIMVVLGGMGSLSGSIIAAIFVTIFPELLRPVQELTGVDLRMVIYSLSLILIMILRPQGLFGKKEFPALLKKWKNQYGK